MNSSTTTVFPLKRHLGWIRVLLRLWHCCTCQGVNVFCRDCRYVITYNAFIRSSSTIFPVIWRMTEKKINAFWVWITATSNELRGVFILLWYYFSAPAVWMNLLIITVNMCSKNIPRGVISHTLHPFLICTLTLLQDFTGLMKPPEFHVSLNSLQ